MLKVLLVELLDVLALEFALQDHVVLGSQCGLGTQLSRDEAHHVVVLAVEVGAHHVEVLPGGLGGAELHDVGVLAALELAALSDLLVLVLEEGRNAL